MSNQEHYYHRSPTFILLKQTFVKKSESDINSFEEKYPPAQPGTLLELVRPDESLFRILNSQNIYLTCRGDELEVLDFEELLLLIPIQSYNERLQVFKDKQWLYHGKELQVCDIIFVKLKDSHTEIEGVIRYKGPVDSTNGIYFGVELKESRGYCDGSYNDMRCFKTEPNHAVFVPLHRIRKSREDWHKNDILRASESQSNRNSLRAENKSSNRYVESPPVGVDLKIGERIVWPSDSAYERGTVKWIGTLPDEPTGGITIGVEFDNPVGSGTGKYKERRLFYATPNHASLIPPIGLMREKDFLSSNLDTLGMNAIIGDQETSWQKNKSFTNQYVPGFPQAKADVNKSSLPVHFNHYTGYLDPMGTANGGSPPMYEQTPKQGRVTGSLSNRALQAQELEVGSHVEVQVQSKLPLYGVIRWIGYTDANKTRLTAGLELEADSSIGTDGTFQKIRYFTCPPGRALFLPLSKCVKDRRCPASDNNGSQSSPIVPGDIAIPDIFSKKDLLSICGKNRGIQGHHNSCYLDSTLFSMFYFSNVFDSIFNRPPNENDLPQYQEVQRVLKEGIVNPLRKHNYVSSSKVWELRVLLDKLGTVPGMMGEEKDVEEFLSALLSQIMKADPLLHLSTGEHAYFYQLFMEKDENLLLPATQKLVELSFLQGNVKLKEVPACLMIQMPRFGKDYKMFRRILPSLELDITDILENSPRDCFVCGDLATWECKKCYQVHGHGLNTTAFCDNCKITSHQHVSRKNHRPESISTHSYLPHFQKKKEEERERNRREKGSEDSKVIVPLPREKMELFAVICIQTSHYVSFVKCGPGINAPWVFFDSMADRIGEQGGYNIPEVVHIPEMATWLSGTHIGLLNKDDKDLPEHLRRILCDGYMCMYQSPDVMMYQ